MLIIILFILGLFFGSFFLVLADRLPRGEAVLIGRSHCEFCKHKLAWHDLIPVISYIFLIGKCRYCHKNFGVRYPLVELSTGLLFVITFFLLQNSIKYQVSSIMYIPLGFYLYITGTFIVIFLADMFYGIIPDVVLFPAIIVSILYLILNTKYLILTSVLAGFGAFGFFLLLFLLTRGKGIGFGDVKLALLVGLLTGFPGIIISLYIAFISGAIIALILITLGKKKLRGDTISFGPFILLGTYITIFFGDLIWKFLALKVFHII